MRADGSTFPVELAVTRPELPGPPLFCGYLRDVTERRRAELALQGMAEEQAALRRVATAVAAEVEPERLFGLVAEEVGRALDAGIGNILRYRRRRHRSRHGRVERRTPTRSRSARRWSSTATRSPRTIWRTHRPARYDSLEGRTGSLADTLRSTGIKAAVGAPVIFAGDLWGAVIISSDGAPFPPEAEFRVGDFADLAAQAIANAQAREELAASRMRIVEASDAERRRLERNLHDGAQQRLVATSLSRAPGGPPRDRRPRRARDARRRRRRARRSRWRSCASSRAGCIPPSSPTTACARRSRRSPTARRCPSRSTCRSTSACPRPSRPRPTSSSARR